MQSAESVTGRPRKLRKRPIRPSFGRSGDDLSRRRAAGSSQVSLGVVTHVAPSDPELSLLVREGARSIMYVSGARLAVCMNSTTPNRSTAATDSQAGEFEHVSDFTSIRVRGTIESVIEQQFDEMARSRLMISTPDTRSGTVATVRDVRVRPSARGRSARPRVLAAPAGRPKAGPAAPVVSVAPATAAPLRLTSRGVAVIIAILLAQFVTAVVVITVSFLSVSNEPLPQAPVAAVSLQGP